MVRETGSLTMHSAAGSGRGRGRLQAGRPGSQHGIQQKATTCLAAVADRLPPQGVTEEKFLSLWHQQHLEPFHHQAYSCVSLWDFISRFGGQQVRQVLGHDGSRLVAPRPTKEAFEAAIRRLRRALHDAGSQVTLSRVQSQALQLFHIDDIRQLGYHSFKACVPLSEVQFLEQQINTIIACFLATRLLCTIHDLEAFICYQLNRSNSSSTGVGDKAKGGSAASSSAAGGAPPPPPPPARRSNDGGSNNNDRTAAPSAGGAAGQFKAYADLGMGPLLAHELVINNFRVPLTVIEVPKISAQDVLVVAWEILSERPYGDKSDLMEPLQQRLVQQHGVASFNELGVRLPAGAGHLIMNLGSSGNRWQREVNSVKHQVESAAKRVMEEERSRVQRQNAEVKQQAQRAVMQAQHLVSDLANTRIQAHMHATLRQLQQGAAEQLHEASWEVLLQPLQLQELQQLLHPDGSSSSGGAISSEPSSSSAASSDGGSASPAATGHLSQEQLQAYLTEKAPDLCRVLGPGQAEGFAEFVQRSFAEAMAGITAERVLAAKQLQDKQQRPSAGAAATNSSSATADGSAALEDLDLDRILQAVLERYKDLLLHPPAPQQPLDGGQQELAEQQCQQPSTPPPKRRKKQRQPAPHSQAGPQAVAQVVAEVKPPAVPAAVAAAQAAAKVLVDGLSGVGAGRSAAVHAARCSFWQSDALNLLLVHALRTSLQGGLGLGRSSDGGGGGGGTDAQEAQQEQQQAPGLVRRQVGALELLHVLQEVCKGSSLAALSELEQEFLIRFRAASFDQLQLPGGATSMLSLLAQQADMGHLVTGWQGSGDIGCHSQQEVLQVVRQVVVNLAGKLGLYLTAHDKLEAVAGAVDEVLRCHYHITNTLQLGHGSARQLLQLLADTLGPSAAEKLAPTEQLLQVLLQLRGGQEQQQAVHTWAAQSISHTGVRHQVQAQGLTPQHAIAALTTAPLLADLRSYCCWDALYAPVLGPLEDFAAAHAEQLQCSLLAVPGGGLLKLPCSCEELPHFQTKLSTAVAQGSANGLVGHLLAHVASRGGVAAADDLVLLAGVMEPLLSAAMASHRGYTCMPAATWGAGLRYLVDSGAAWGVEFTLQCLQVLPLPLAGALADQLLLQPLVSAIGQGQEAAHLALLRLATVAEAAPSGAAAAHVAAGVAMKGPRQVLHTLGHLLGVEAWQDDCLAATAPAAAVTAALGSSAATSAAADATGGHPGASILAAGAAGGGAEDAGVSAEAMDDLLTELLGVPAPATAVAADTTAASTEASEAAGKLSAAEQTAGAVPSEVNVVGSVGAAAGPSAATPEDAGSEPQLEATDGVSAAAELGIKAAAASTPAPPSELQPAEQGAGADTSASPSAVDGVAPAVTSVLGTQQDEAKESASMSEGEIAAPLEQVREDLGEPNVAEALQDADQPPAVALQPEPQPATPEQQFVQAIRRSYGIGLQLEGEAATVFAENQQRLGLSVRRLAGELYSRDIHFVMELVQNADDCQYPAGLGLRMLELVVTPRAVSLLSNEAGFSQQDVKGICNISKSKKEGMAGYTGQKGIGFKSVFRVTDFPRIYSNGYAFGFDRIVDDDLGYLLPTWVGLEAVPPEFERALAASRLLRTTCPAGANGAAASLFGPSTGLTGLHLPLKEHLQDNVGVKLAQVQPTLLLFLRKLCALAITDTAAGQSTLMVRKEQPGGILQLHARRSLLPGAADQGSGASCGEVVLRDEITRWLLVTDTFSPGDIKRLEVEVDTTSVSLGFALDGVGPTEQSVYAFLPVRRCGLKFMLQGDFVVPSNRGDVDQDNPWNQLLRSRVPGLLAAALSRFKALQVPPGQTALHWVDWWLQCIPLKSTVQAHEFFAQLPAEVSAKLRATPCIPTEGPEGSVGTWVPPGLALICPNPRVRQLLSSPQLVAIKQQHFVHPGVPTLHQNKELRQLLGVQEYDPVHLVQLLQELSAAGQLACLGTEWLRQLLLCLFSMMFDQPLTSGASAAASAAAGGSGMAPALRLQLLQDLQAIPLLPVHGQPGHLWAAAAVVPTGQAGSQRQLFLPLDMPQSRGQHPAVQPQKQQQAKGPHGRGSHQKAATSSAPHNSSSSSRLGAAAGSRTAADLLRAASLSQVQLCSVATPGSIQQQLLVASSAAGDARSRRSGSKEVEQQQGLLFLDAELLQVADAGEQALLLKGLQELRVRQLEPMDVVEGWVLPNLTAWDTALQAVAAQDVAAGNSTAAAADTEGVDSAAAEGAVGPSTAVVQVQLTRAQQQLLMALLAFPLAAGLVQQQLQQPPQGQPAQQQLSRGTDAVEGGTLLDQLRQVAVAVTADGRPVRLGQLQQAALAAASAAYSSPKEGGGGREGTCSGQLAALVHLPAALGNFIDLPQVFPAHPWVLLSPAYANCLAPQAGVGPQVWGQLFRCCGVVEWLPLVQLPRSFSWKQLLLEQPAWRDAVQQLGGKDRVVIQDMVCPAFSSLLAAIKAEPDSRRRQDQLKSLAQLLGTHWQVWSDKGALAATPLTEGAPQQQAAATRPLGSSGSYTAPSQQLPSSFLLQLQELSWLLSSRGEPCTPATLLVCTSQCASLLQDKVAYVGVDQLPPPMLRALGVTSAVTPELLLQVLKTWSAAAEAGTAFETSVAHMVAVYTFMQDALGWEPLPASGFGDLDNPGHRKAAQAQGVLDRLLACRMFSDHALVWLPDVPAVAAAAQAAAAAADPWGNGGSSRGRGRNAGPSAAAAAATVGGGVSGEAVQLLYRQDIMPKLYSKKLPGRFYTPEQLRYRDEAQVLEQQQLVDQLQQAAATAAPGQAPGAGAAGGAVQGQQQVQRLRVVSLYYPTLFDLFVKQLQRYRRDWIPLVGEYATVGDYCRLLDRVMLVAGEQVDPASTAYTQVMRVLTMWSKNIETNDMKYGAQQTLYDQLMLPSSVAAPGAGQRRFFPSTRGTWEPLTISLLIDDMPEVSQLFADEPAVAFVAATPDTITGRSSGRATGMRQPGALGRLDPSSDVLFPLLQAMEVPRLSAVVRPLLPVATDPSPDRELHYVLAVAAPLLQRMALQRLGQAGCTASDAEFRAHLAGVECWGVTALERRVGLPIAGAGVAAAAGQDGLVAAVPCEVLLVLGEGEGEQVVIQQRRKRPVPARMSEDDLDDYGEEEEVEEEEPNAAGSEGDAAAAAEARGSQVAPAAGAAAAPGQQGDDDVNVGQAGDLSPQSVRLYVKLPWAGALPAIAAELSQLVGAVARRVLRQHPSTQQQQLSGAWTALQQDAARLLEQLMFAQEMGGALYSWAERPEYRHLPPLPKDIDPWTVPVPEEQQAQEEQEPEEPDAAAAAAAALVAQAGALADIDWSEDLEETEQAAAVRQLHTNAVQMLLEKRQQAAAAAAASGGAAEGAGADGARTVGMADLLHVSTSLLPAGAVPKGTAKQPAQLSPEAEAAAAADPQRLQGLLAVSDWPSLAAGRPVEAAAAGQGAAGEAPAQGAMAAVKAVLPGPDSAAAPRDAAAGGGATVAAATAASDRGSGSGVSAAAAGGGGAGSSAAAPHAGPQGLAAGGGVPQRAARDHPPGLEQPAAPTAPTAAAAPGHPEVPVAAAAEGGAAGSAAEVAPGVSPQPVEVLAAATGDAAGQHQQQVGQQQQEQQQQLGDTLQEAAPGPSPTAAASPAAAIVPSPPCGPLYLRVMHQLQQLQPVPAVAALQDGAPEAADTAVMAAGGPAAAALGGSRAAAAAPGVVDTGPAAARGQLPPGPAAAGVQLAAGGGGGGSGPPWQGGVGGGGWGGGGGVGGPPHHLHTGNAGDHSSQDGASNSSSGFINSTSLSSSSSSSTCLSRSWLRVRPHGPAVSLQLPGGNYAEAVAAACQSGRMMARPVVLPQLVLQTALASVCSLQLPSVAALGEGGNEDSAVTGRLGEALAHSFLQQLVGGPGSSGGAGRQQQRVVWVNAVRETGLPFDLLLLQRASADAPTAAVAETQQIAQQLAAVGVQLEAQQRVLAYVEVKATRAHHKELFEVSQGELAFAAEAGDRYWVLRVAGLQGVAEAAPAALAGQEVAVAPTIQQLVNPVLLWQQKALRVCVVY